MRQRQARDRLIERTKGVNRHFVSYGLFERFVLAYYFVYRQFADGNDGIGAQRLERPDKRWPVCADLCLCRCKVPMRRAAWKSADQGIKVTVMDNKFISIPRGMEPWVEVCSRYIVLAGWPSRCLAEEKYCH